MADSDPQINIARIKVAGVGGFGLVVIIVAMAFDLPAVRVFVIAGLTGGVVGAAARALYHRWVTERAGPTEPGSIFKLDDSRRRTSGRTRTSVPPFDRLMKSASV